MKGYKLLSIVLLSSLVLFPTGCGITTAQSTDRDRSPGSNTSDPTQQTIAIIGASTAYPALKLLATAYQQTTDNVTITFLESSKSSGGITGVKAGLVELGSVTRPPKPEEADNDLTHYEIAQDALVIATHPSVEGVNNLSTEQLQGIYSGQITNWRSLGGPDADIVVLDRDEDTSAKRLLREQYLGTELANAPNAIVLRRESNLIEALQDTPYSIGILSLSKVVTQALPLNPLSLNGISPTADNIATNQYTLNRTLGLVFYRTPSPATQAFIDFIFSQSGTAALHQAGYVPMTQ